MAGFRSLRERAAGPPDPDETLPLNVHPYMRQPLHDWLVKTISTYDTSGHWQLLCQMLKIDYTGKRPYSAVVDAVNTNSDILLDLIDARLRMADVWAHVEDLRETLLLAGSGWQVNEAGEGLEQVVDEVVRSAALAAIAAAEDSAASHLRNAWAATHGRSRNATHAHAEMIRAVESAARPVVTPNDLQATLGKILRQLETQADLYTSAGASPANDGVAGIVAMMNLLWQQQTDRHGANPTVPATQARVEFLLPIAAALVHAFSTGAVRRV